MNGNIIGNFSKSTFDMYVNLFSSSTGIVS